MKFKADTFIFILMLCVALSLSDGDCKAGSKVIHRPFSDTIVNQTLVGPVMSSITAKNERECEMECHLAVPDKCYMFNYHPSSKVCELLYKDRPAEYKVEKKEGSTFRTHKCYVDPCINEGQCYSLGVETKIDCLCPPMLQGVTCEACKDPLSTAVQHIDVITNYTIVGPILKSLTALSEGICQCFCQWHGQASCYMFNYYPSSKVCELFYKNRPAEYKVEKKDGSTFKAPKCATDQCNNGGSCLLLGHENLMSSHFCMCKGMFQGRLCQNHTCDAALTAIQYTKAYVNYTIVGPVLWSFVATDQSACECACHNYEQSLCYMLNFNPTNKSCELFFKNRTADYSVVARTGSMFKTRKCRSSPCRHEGQCYSLGNQTSSLCLCPPMLNGTDCDACKDPLSTAVQHIDVITNYTIVGPILKSLTASSEGICQCFCQWYGQASCYMFNYYPSSKVCELFYKNRPAEYKVEKKDGSTFKAPKCRTDPCMNGGQCLLLGSQETADSKRCLCKDMVFNGTFCQNHTCDAALTAIQYTKVYVNYAIVGPVLWSFVATDQSACECACHNYEQSLCYMLNFNPTNKSCELFFKNRAADYSVVARTGSTFKTRKCATDPPCYKGRCYSLGDHNSNLCWCDFGYSGKHCHVFATGIKVNTNPVCIGTKNNAFGTFVAPFNGKVKTFRLVHLSGGVGHGAGTDTQGRWGAKEYTDWLNYNPSKIELHVTHPNKARITPPVGYLLFTDWGRMGWDIAGYNYNSPELVFPEISPITVTKGQTFNIWFGQDYTDSSEDDNHGTTCANVYMLYTE